MKKSQITIFIVLFFIILFLFISLISLKKHSKINKLKTNTNEIISETKNLDTFNIKDYVDRCLDRSIDKALILVGLQGGYVNYDTLDSNLDLKKIKNNLNFDVYHNTLNYLGNFLGINPGGVDVLVYSPFYGYINDENTYNLPILDYSNKNSVQKNMEGFIEEDTIKCLNLTKFLEMGYDYEIFANKPNVTVTIKSNVVLLNFKYPFKIINKKTGTESYFKESSLHKNIRLGKIISVAREFIYNLYQNNHPENFEDEKIIFQNIVENNGMNSNNFNLYKLIVRNEEDWKEYIYLIEDKLSKIKGEPYLFDVGYENIAPVLDLPEECGFVEYPGSENTYFTFVNDNEPFECNLSKFVRENNLIDDLFNRKIGDKEEIVPNSYDFKLKNKIITYTNYDSLDHSFEIVVSDGETVRRYTLIFLYNGYSNEGNANTLSRFRVTVYDRIGVQIGSCNHNFSVYMPYKNFISEYVDENDFHHVYTFCLYGGNINITFNPNLAPGTYLENNCGGTKNCYLSSVEERKDVVFTVKTGDRVLSTYNITVYPAKCLGPYPLHPVLQEFVGGDFTCCNMSMLEDYNNFKDSDYINNLMPLGHVAADYIANLLFDIDKLEGLNSYIEDNSVNLWDEQFILVPSNVTTHIKAVCDGLTPDWKDNTVTEGNSGSIEISPKICSFDKINYNKDTKFCKVFVSEVNENLCFDSDGNPIGNSLDSEEVDLDCILSYLNTVISFNLSDDFIFPYVELFPSKTLKNEEFKSGEGVRCDNNIYVKEDNDDISSVFFGTYGKGDDPRTTYAGYKVCSSNFKCENYNWRATAEDDQKGCIDKYITFGNVFENPPFSDLNIATFSVTETAPPSFSWVCGGYSCNDQQFNLYCLAKGECDSPPKCNAQGDGTETGTQ